MTINVNGAGAAGIVVNGGTVIGTQNNTSYHYSYRPFLFRPFLLRA